MASSNDNFDPTTIVGDNEPFEINQWGNQLVRGAQQRGYMVARQDKPGSINIPDVGTGAVTTPVSPFRLHFMWNPAEIQKAYVAMIGTFIADQNPSQASIRSPGQSSFQFSILLNREKEMNQASDGPTDRTGSYLDSPRRVGVLHDVKVFETVAGIQIPSDGQGGITIQSTYVDVYFSKNMMFSGYITDAKVTFAKFTHAMVPTVAVIEVSLIIWYAGVATPNDRTGVTTAQGFTANTGNSNNRYGGDPTTTNISTGAGTFRSLTSSGFAPIGRHVWGAPNADLIDTKPQGTFPLSTVIIHHVGGGYIATNQQVAACRQIDTSTKSADGSCIVYNYMVGIDGTAFEARGDRQSAATLNFNSVSTAICALGNFMTEDVTPELLQGIQNMISWLVASGQVSAGATIEAHRDVGSTLCCGDNLYAYVHAGYFQAV